jgi:hypothetical protein
VIDYSAGDLKRDSYFRFKPAIPSSRAGFGELLWQLLGYGHELAWVHRGLGKMVPRPTGVCARRLEQG